MMHKYSALKTSKTPLTASVIGARGYSGIELVKLLLKHPAVELKYAFATQAFKLADYLLDGGVEKVQTLGEDQVLSHLTDVVFMATPAEVSLELAPKILAQGKTVIDLSGAFRLKTSDYKKWYNFEHTQKEELKNAHFGLVPFAGPSKSPLISNPGCYATAILMALIPLLKRNLISAESLVIDAKSGTTGAGRKGAENLIFSEVAGECLPYKIGKHQHMPEIKETIEKFCGVSIDPHFSTHLLPVDRGIVAGIYAQAKVTDISAIQAAFEEDYKEYPLVRHQKGIGTLVKLKNVVGTPYTHISYELVDNKLYVFSCLDNLMKGAASQAVENFNLHFDLPAHTGLLI